MNRQPAGDKPNSPNAQPSRVTRPDSPNKPTPSKPGRKKCPPGFKWVNGRCEFVYDKNKYKK